MKFSESWLREWVNPEVSTAQLVAQLTMAGLEVDAVDPVAGDFSGVVVGEIIKVDPHPDAEKLRICSVMGNGNAPLQVVCGAANARVGIKVPFATIGAILPGDFAIKKAKLRGVESFGMLCAQTELKAGEDDEGLWELPSDAPVGEDLRKYLNLDDQIIEVDLTPNRGDCLSIRGLAREVGVLNRTNLTLPKFSQIECSSSAEFEVSVSASEACPVYAGRVITNVDISCPSPQWLVEKLRRGGVRSIDPVVDVTNYVLLELGQPMHAFDLDKLAGGIDVRMATEGEKILLLDGQEVSLLPQTLVIADNNGAVALAGVMGGNRTSVSETTKNIFLESAFFTPEALAGKARAYGLHTDSSHRFERGVDYDLQCAALERATELLVAITGGDVGPIILKRAADAARSSTIVLRKLRLAKSLGLSLEDSQVEDILTRLGLEIIEKSNERWIFSVPSHRFDLGIEEDLVEEIARVYGYDHLPIKATQFSLNLPKKSETESSSRDFKSHLVSRGFQEVITYSFIDPVLHSHFTSEFTPVTLRNPISSEMSSMRTSLIPGLVSVLKTNLSRQKTRVHCFEEGMRFCSTDGSTNKLTQERTLAGLIYGSREPASWLGKAVDADFFDLKGHVESLLKVMISGKPIEFRPTVTRAYLHPGQSAEIVCEGKVIGVLGALHPSTQKALDLSKPPYVFELLLDSLVTRPLPRFAGLSRFPEVTRDLAVVVNKDTPLAKLSEAINAAAGNCLTNLKLFDVYRGEGIDTERKSLAFSLTFQHSSRTLKDEEINASIEAILQCLKDEFGAIFR